MSSSTPKTNPLFSKNRDKTIKLFYSDSMNGGWMIQEYLENKENWARVENRQEAIDNWDQLTLFFAQCKFKSIQNNLEPEKQLIYQIPNNSILTNKIGLLSSLRSYDKYLQNQPTSTSWHMNYNVFLPQTYRMDIREERDEFIKNYQEGEVWISKPTACNRGIGIYLLQNKEDIEKMRVRLEERENKRGVNRPAGRIVSRYILYPLLLNRRKFDVRSYVLIQSTPQGHICFFRPGYCRLSINEYAVSETDLSTHLTNQALQVKNPNYESVKEETIWSMDKFNDYINETCEHVPSNWVKTTFDTKCKQIASHCLAATNRRLDRRVGFFDLIGIDYIIDENFNVYLLEMNTNPALLTNCSVLEEVIPETVNEMMDLTLEIYDHYQNNNTTSIRLPLKSQNNFRCIYNATRTGGVTPWRVNSAKPKISEEALSEYLKINNKRVNN